MSNQSFDLPHSTRNFLECLFGQFFRDHAGYIEFRVIKPTEVHQHFYPSLLEAYSESTVRTLTDWNQDGFNIYLGVSPRCRKNGEAEDVKYVTALWADLDFKKYKGGENEVWERLGAFPVPPSAVNHSGHGLHTYWFLDQIHEAVDPNKIRGIIKGIGKALGGDAVFDLNRVLRLPGFMNVKAEPFVPCQVLEECFFPERRYSLTEFENFWIDPGLSATPVELKNIPEEMPERFRKILEKDSDLRDTWYGRKVLPNDNSRSGFDMSLAQQLRPYNFTDEEVASILKHSPSGKGSEARPQYLAYTIAKTHESKKVDDDLPDYEALLEQASLETPKDKLPDVLDDFFRALAYQNVAKIHSVLQYAVKERFGLTNEDVKRYEKTVFSYKKLIPAEKEKMEEDVFEDTVMVAGEQILNQPKLLYQVSQALKEQGLAGEEKTALIHFLALTSRLLPNPVSVTVKGDSSAGKSFTLGKVMKFMPRNAYHDLTDATPMSFYYSKPDQYKHKTIVIFERHGTEKSDYAIRSLQSEGKLVIQVTIKNPETNEYEAKTIERDGPTNFITTTTASQIHSENETRNLSIFPDQSEEQTVRVYGTINNRFLGKPKPGEEELKKYRAAQLHLVTHPIYIPFVESIGAKFPTKVMRTRRDYERFLAVIEASALVHQKQRVTTEISGVTYIRATLADYYIAKVLSEEYFSKSIYEIPPKTLEVIDAAKKLCLEAGSDDEKNFTITQLAKSMGWDRDTVAKWMEPAEKKSYMTKVEESRGNKGAKYIVEDKPLPTESFLPDVDVMAYQNPEEPLDGIYNPITGEVIEIKMIDAIEGLKKYGFIKPDMNLPSVQETPPADPFQAKFIS